MPVLIPLEETNLLFRFLQPTFTENTRSAGIFRKFQTKSLVMSK